MVGFDPIAGKDERIERLAVAGGKGDLDLVGTDLQPNLAELDPIEPSAVLDERLVATYLHVGDYRPHGCFDVGHGLALAREKGAKSGSKSGSTAVEADGQ